MSTSDYHEPTNDELWLQPPTSGTSSAETPQSLSPAPQAQAPAPLPVPHASGSTPQQQRPDRSVFVLAIISLALGIPLTAIATGTAGLAGLLVVWVGIVLLNAVYAWSRRR